MLDIVFVLVTMGYVTTLAQFHNSVVDLTLLIGIDHFIHRHNWPLFVELYH